MGEGRARLVVQGESIVMDVETAFRAFRWIAHHPLGAAGFVYVGAIAAVTLHAYLFSQDWKR